MAEDSRTVERILESLARMEANMGHMAKSQEDTARSLSDLDKRLREVEMRWEKAEAVGKVAIFIASTGWLATFVQLYQYFSNNR